MLHKFLSLIRNKTFTFMFLVLLVSVWTYYYATLRQRSHEIKRVKQKGVTGSNLTNKQSLVNKPLPFDQYCDTYGEWER
jgi:hypothetical protein